MVEKPPLPDPALIREIATALIQGIVSDASDLIGAEVIEDHIDGLEASGRIPRASDPDERYEALNALRDAVAAELADAAGRDAITVTIQPIDADTSWPPRSGDIWISKPDQPAHTPEIWVCSNNDWFSGMRAETVQRQYGPMRLIWRAGEPVTTHHTSRPDTGDNHA